MGVAEVLVLLGLLAVCMAGLVLTVFQLPGTWLILGGAVLYSWYHHWERMGAWTLGVLLGVAIVGEALEQVSGMWAVRKGGGSRRAAWWGLVGGIAGALLLSVPVPVIGTVIGAAAGCFLGAVAAELSQQRDTVHAGRVGVFSALGRTAGTLFKLGAALVMAGVAMGVAVFGSWG